MNYYIVTTEIFNTLTKDNISLILGCFKIDKVLVEVTVNGNEKGILEVLLSLEVVISWFPTVPVTVALGEKLLRVTVTSSVWYIIFWTKPELEPLEEFISIVLSSRLTSIYSECFVSSFNSANK